MKKLLVILSLTLVFIMAMPGLADATELFKYDPPIDISFGKPIDVNNDSLVRMEKAGEPLTDNRWTRYFRDDVGVNTSYKLTGVEPDYGQKLLLGMAAGDLPDVFWVTDLSILKQLVDAGAVADLTDAYEQYANPTLHDVLEYEGMNIWNPVTFEGRKYAIPVKMPSTNGYNHLWVRQEWLDKLGLERPKTMDDVMAVAKAFVEGDPNGNGQADEIGVMLSKDYVGESKGIFWTFGGKTAVRKYWDTQEDGSVVFSEVQPEMKGGLKWLREMYKAGLVNQEFATQDITKAFEYVANNQCGIFFAPHWYGFRLYAADEAMGESNWCAIGLPVDDKGEPTKVFATNTFDAVYCVREGFEHPEAIVHLFNAYAEKLFGPENDFDNFFSCPENDAVWNAGPIHTLHSLVDLTPHRDMKVAVANGTTDQLTGAGKSFYNYITSGQKSYYYMFGWKDACFNFVDDTYPDIIKWNGYMGAPTETWGDRWSSMQELIDTSFLAMIQGEEDIDQAFDKMVEQWNSIGGQQVTEEVNAIVASY